MNIQEIRQKYPQYEDMSDEQLAGAMHSKFYSDIPRSDFDQKIGFSQVQQDESDQPFFFQKGANVEGLPTGTLGFPQLPSVEKIQTTAREALPFAASLMGTSVGINPLLAIEALKTERTPQIIKGVVTNPAVVGTLASIIAPPLAVPAALSKVPAVGGLLTSIGQNIPSIAASTVAGGVTEAGRELIDNPDATIGSAAEKGLETGKDFLKGNLLGVTAAHGLGKALTTGAEFVDDGAKKLIQFAKDHKIPLKPTAVSPSKTAKTVEEFTEAFLPSKIVNRFADKKIAKVLTTNTDEANSIIAQSSMIDGLNSPGADKVIPDARKAIQEGIEKWIPKMEQNYTKFIDSIGGKDTIVPDYQNVKSAMRAALKEIDDPTDPVYQFIERFAKRTRAFSKDSGLRTFNAKDIKSGDIFGDITAGKLQQEFIGLGKVSKSDNKIIGAIRDAFKADFESIGTALGNKDSLELLKKASTEYGIGRQFFAKNDVIRKIAKGKIPDERVTIELFRDKNFNVLKQLEANIPDKEFKNLMRLNVESLIENTALKSDALQTGKQYSLINGKKILDWIDKNPKTFQLLPTQTQNSLKNLALYAKLHLPQAVEGKKDLFSALSKSTAITGATGASVEALKRFGEIDPTIGVLLPAAGAFGLSFSLMKPGSIVNKWLTTGIPTGFGTREVLKLGGREAFSGGE